jgi:hypothetical protein
LIDISKYGEFGNGHFAHTAGITGFYNPISSLSFLRPHFEKRSSRDLALVGRSESSARTTLLIKWVLTVSPELLRSGLRQYRSRRNGIFVEVREAASDDDWPVE